METIQRDDGWWRRDDSGTWYRWNDATQSWEFAPVQTPAAASSDYRSARALGRWLAILLGAGMVLDVAASAVFYAELQLAERRIAGLTVGERELLASDIRLGLLALAVLVILLVTVPVFVIWFQRLYTNASALGATGLRFSRGWAAGAWFVPILNLWRPKQIADDIWRASDPGLPARAGDAWQTEAVGRVVHLWWGLYLLSNLVNQAVLRVSTGADTLAQLRTEALVESGAAGLDALTAGVAMVFVLRMTARQELRAATAGPSVQE